MDLAASGRTGHTVWPQARLWGAAADYRFEPGLGAGSARVGAEDRHVDAGLAVGFEPLAALRRRPGDAGGVDHAVADRAHGALAVACGPGGGNRRGLLGKAVLGHQ